MSQQLPKVTKYQDGDRLFIRSFLIDASINENSWGVSADSIPKNIKSFVGMPIVLTNDYSHPKLVDGQQLQPNLDYQERFAIGKIVDVVEKEGKWDAIQEITDPLAKEAISNNEIPFYVSPRIFITQLGDSMGQIRNWIGVHNAVVDDPAYGKGKATIDAVCAGSGTACIPALLSAQSDSQMCSCRKQTLLRLLTNQQSNSSHSSHVRDAEKIETVMENSPQAPDLSGYVAKDVYDKLAAEFTAAKEAFGTYQKNTDSKLAAIELESTTAKISNILSAKIENKEELAAKVKYFVEAKVAPEVVSEAFRMVPDISTKAVKDNTGKFQEAKVEVSPIIAKQLAYEERRFA